MAPQPSVFSQVNHTVALSTIGESNYHFGVTYVGTKQLSPTEVRFLLSVMYRVFLLTKAQCRRRRELLRERRMLGGGDWLSEVL